MTPNQSPRWMYWVLPLMLVPTAFMLWVAVTVGLWFVPGIYVVLVGATIFWGRRRRRTPIAADFTAPALATVRMRPDAVRIDVTGLSAIGRRFMRRQGIEIPLSQITGVHVDDEVTKRSPGYGVGIIPGWAGRKVVIGTFFTISGPSVKSWYAFRRGRPALVIDFHSNDIHEAVADVDDPAIVAQAIEAALRERAATEAAR